MADTRMYRIATLLAVISLVACNSQRNEQQNYKIALPTTGSPWPAPQKMTIYDQQFPVDDNNFRFVLSSNQRCDIVEQAFVRYQEITFGPQWSSLKFRRPIYHGKQAVVDTLQVHIMSVCKDGAYPSLSSDESYTLQIDDSGAVLSAKEAWGALRGLETFSQLVYKSNTGQFMINHTDILDFPRFKHRGLLVDTSRHFLSMKVLMTNLDIMAQNKFNVFHWHIVDDPSFPYESRTFPDMSGKGAYEPFTHVYTQENVREIIEYARMRGIRVIPEFDSPGHTQSWGKAITDLLTKCYSGGSWTGSYGPVNPVPNTTYNFLQQFFSELSTVFPDHYLHLGGDEVSFGCWQSNPEITKFMNTSGFGKDYAKLEEYYMTHLLKIVKDLSKGYIIWQEVIDNGAKLAGDTVVEVWKGGYQKEMSRVTSLGYKVAMDTVVHVWKSNYENELDKVTKLGYQALLSSCWYLDYIAIGPQWESYYKCDPQQFNGTLDQKALVVGGEACVWGEYVDDTNLISRTWPRASAVAERLWSSVTVNNVDQAVPRMAEHRCRLVRRGYPAEPPSGPNFCKDEFVYHG